MNFWVVFLVLMFVPGLINVYASIKLLKFRKTESGLASFLLCSANGAFDMIFSLILLLAILFGNLVLELDLSNIFVLVLIVSIVISFLWWRFIVSTHCLWLLGLVELNWFEALPEEYRGIRGWTAYRYKTTIDNISWILRTIKGKIEEIKIKYGPRH